MTARKKVAPAPASVEQPITMEVSVKLLKWVGGIAGALVAIGGLVWSVTSWMDNHWRLEKDQAMQDKLVAAQISAAQTKASTDLEAHKIAEARQIAWLTYSIQDFRAAAAGQWAKQCPILFKSKDQCVDAADVVIDAKQKANEARAAAQALSKEK